MDWDRSPGRWASVGLALAACLGPGAGPAGAATVPAGFQHETVLSPGSLANPTAIAFSPDGQVFVAERQGTIRVLDSVEDDTPALFADLRAEVHAYSDRGLLGLALDPGFPADPFVYASYSHDAAIGGTAPTWGAAAGEDGCPDPPGAFADGCLISSRISRLTANGDVSVGEQVLVEDWCQQYSSHSAGDLAFGASGALFGGGGDGAHFGVLDYGQLGGNNPGFPSNPCGDPPGGVDGPMSPPTAEGGSLRAQDLRTDGDPVTLDGSVIRIDPQTGAGLPDNPLADSDDPNARRIVAFGLRNPYRFAVRPGTDELWIGDVGQDVTEEIDRVRDNAEVAVNYGWPCYEGPRVHAPWAAVGVDLCDSLYDGEAATAKPVLSYDRDRHVVPGDGCGTQSQAISGLEFYEGGAFPPSYEGALFFADYGRGCIWTLKAGEDGIPDPDRARPFAVDASVPVDLELGPDGALYYVDFWAGAVHRILYTGGAQPTARISASHRFGPLPLRVRLDGSRSAHPGEARLRYAWDLDGDGRFDEAKGRRVTRRYRQRGPVTAGLEVRDPDGHTDVATVELFPGDTPPRPRIVQPVTRKRWSANQSVEYAGMATDAEDGGLPPSALEWELILRHCPANCHSHLVSNSLGDNGVFTAPDHEYPSKLWLSLSVTDADGMTRRTRTVVKPKTATLKLRSSHRGLRLGVNNRLERTPFDVPVIKGSLNTLLAPSPQTLRGTEYEWSHWSDGEDRTHGVVLDSDRSFRATYTP